ncbi:MAG: hypothetical protein GYA21_18780 [Myxococcales bacterium]|nr:hypothetical protein [Myxococcales bacterium]
MQPFSGVKVFSATLTRDREELGEQATRWLAEHPGVEVTDLRVVQSSDREFHCVSIVMFYRETGAESGAATG